MKIYLTNTLEHQKHTASLQLATQFLQEAVTIVSDYPITIQGENVTISQVDDVFTQLANESDTILYAPSSTVFTAEALSDLVGAYTHFKQQFLNLMMQLTHDNELLQYPEPTLTLYGGRRLWQTSSRATSNVLYGDARTIANYLSNPQQRLFNNGIFHGGETTLLTPLPPLAFDTSKELPAQVSSAAFDAQSYIEAIPV